MRNTQVPWSNSSLLGEVYLVEKQRRAGLERRAIR
jgi:hypothetical protein